MVFVSLSRGKQDRLFDIRFKLLDFWRRDKDIPLMFIITVGGSDETLQVIDFLEKYSLCFDIISH